VRETVLRAVRGAVLRAVSGVVLRAVRETVLRAVRGTVLRAVRGAADPPDVAQRGEPVDVDQVLRRGQPHVQQRDQALPAGQHLAVGAALGGYGGRLVEVGRPVVRERGGLHGCCHASSSGTMIAVPPVSAGAPGAGRRTGPSRTTPPGCGVRSSGVTCTPA